MENRFKENDFFREATKRICGSLDIKTALTRALHYLQNFIPVDAMGLHLYDLDLNVVKLIAKIDIAGNFIYEKNTSLPDAPVYFSKLTKIIRHPERNQLVNKLLPPGASSEISIILLRLMMEDGEWGTLFLLTRGAGRYTEEHERMLALLNEPFTIAMANALKHRRLLELKDKLMDDNRYLQDELHNLNGSKIVGEYSGLKNIMTMVRQVAPLNSPVLLLGETGVGKDVIANVIHYSSSRRNGPFVKVNCGAIPDSLLDSELFGHEKGAFTGALTQKRGRFERAHEGTIFLDEVGELLPQAQVRMLRVLQDKEIERIGSTGTVPVDIRLVTATNKNLEEMVETNLFRKDLWFRLNVFPILIPPLRERKEDIPEFVKYFLEKKSKEMKVPVTPEPSPRAIDLLMDYHWPGNVRELENIIERALILNKGKSLIFDNLLPSRQPEKGVYPAKSGREFLKLDVAVVRHIQMALHLSDGKIHGRGGTAELLGINPSTLRSRMKKLGIRYDR